QRHSRRHGTTFATQLWNPHQGFQEGNMEPHLLRVVSLMTKTTCANFGKGTGRSRTSQAMSSRSRLNCLSKAVPDFGQQGFHVERLAEQSSGTERDRPFLTGDGKRGRDDHGNRGQSRNVLTLIQEPPAIVLSAG